MVTVFCIIIIKSWPNKKIPLEEAASEAPIMFERLNSKSEGQLQHTPITYKFQLNMDE